MKTPILILILTFTLSLIASSSLYINAMQYRDNLEMDGKLQRIADNWTEHGQGYDWGNDSDSGQLVDPVGTTNIWNILEGTE